MTWTDKAGLCGPAVSRSKPWKENFQMKFACYLLVAVAALFLLASPAMAWPWTPVPKPCAPVTVLPAACAQVATCTTCATCETAICEGRRHIAPVRNLLKGVVERHQARVADREARREARHAAKATCSACAPAAKCTACAPACCAPAACTPNAPLGSVPAIPAAPAPK